MPCTSLRPKFNRSYCLGMCNLIALFCCGIIESWCTLLRKLFSSLFESMYWLSASNFILYPIINNTIHVASILNFIFAPSTCIVPTWWYLEAVHKWCHPFSGEEDLPRAYLLKWVTRGWEGSKISKNGWHHLWMALYMHWSTILIFVQCDLLTQSPFWPQNWRKR